MSKGNRIIRLTPVACERIQARMLEACQKIAADHGLAIESAGWRGLERFSLNRSRLFAVNGLF
ncbi:hypothetical protein ACFSOZ_24245 [Mesorhizobium newzealandense]|uniref:Uncharacterized protein n=1 Tax=Mesorhizobium newzealandense TaxID=1300302 RepID=A0ABW4UHA1_9HYPH|nr:hypothetical protein [Mesorhizobium carmichaelinearum]